MLTMMMTTVAGIDLALRLPPGIVGLVLRRPCSLLEKIGAVCGPVIGSKVTAAIWVISMVGVRR